MKKILWVCAAFACAAWIPAQAASSTATLTVSATVAANCTISTTPVAFGVYDPLGAGNADATGTVSITCVKGTAPTSIDLGLGANASGSTRRMTDGTDHINYELYKPTSDTAGAGCAYSAVWTTGAAAIGVNGGFVPTAAPSNTARSYNVCGRTALGQNVGTGTYSDTVDATVNF